MLFVAFALAQEVVERSIPEYPEAAQQDRITGTVVLDVDLAADGSVLAARVVSGLREDVDQAALAAALKLRFAPLPEPKTIQYAFTFALKVEDQQGNTVPATVVLKLVDDGGLEVPGVRVTASNGKEQREILGSDGGVARIPFLEAGRWTLTFEKTGFSSATATVDVLPGETRAITVELSLQTAETTVVVIGTRQRWYDVARAERKPNEEAVTSQYVLTRRDVESTPGALEDVTRAVHKLPGVVSDGDMLGTFSVRGGTSGEVVFMLDRIPLDNPFHLSGFNSIFNPDMLSQVQFFASAAPATMPDTTSAVMDVVSWDGERKTDRNDVDGAIDVSMSTVRATVQGPLGEDFTFAFSGRRSYLEAYFAVMQAIDLLDQAIAAPEYDEIGLRGSFKKDEHKLRLTLLRTSDHLKLVDSEDDSAITIDGSFQMDSVVYLAAMDHTWQNDQATVESTLGFTFDQSHIEQDFGGATSLDVERQQYVARSDGIFALGAGHALDVGFLGQARRYQALGPIEDTRTMPTWAAVPITNFDHPSVEVEDPKMQPQAAFYAQHRWTGPLRTRAGVRGTYVGRNTEMLVSPSFGVSLPLPTATVPKIAGGIYHHVIEDPLTIDPTYGNPDITAERAYTGVIGLDQGLPIGKGGLLRVEGYYSALDALVVNGDTLPTDAPAYQNEGSGHNVGVDVMGVLNFDRFMVMTNASWLDAWRNNPLNVDLAQGYVPGWTQAWTAGAAVEWQALPKFRFTLRYDYHSGRPNSTVEPNGEDSVKIVGLNDQLTGDYHNVDFRLEFRSAGPRIRWSYYFELLNVFYMQPDFLPIVTVEDGERQDSMLSHLPIRPFMGLRADF